MQRLLSIFNDLIVERSPLAAPANEVHTKTRLAIALFECAESGERDHERLKRRALAALGTPRHPGH